jgi:hypothetical protein
VEKRGRPVSAVVLTDQERETLQRWANQDTSRRGGADGCNPTARGVELGIAANHAVPPSFRLYRRFQLVNVAEWFTTS